MLSRPNILLRIFFFLLGICLVLQGKTSWRIHIQQIDYVQKHILDTTILLLSLDETNITNNNKLDIDNQVDNNGQNTISDSIIEYKHVIWNVWADKQQEFVGHEVSIEEKRLSEVPKSQPLQIDDNDLIYKRNLADPSWNGAPVVIEEYKLLFFTVPKVGCTTWLQLFRKIHNYDNWKVQGTRKRLPWKPQTNGLKYLYHYNKTDAIKMMTSPEWTRAIFIRDPKERFISAYIDKALNEEMFITRVCCWKGRHCRDKAKESPQAFLHFIRTSCDDDHWRPQSQRMEDKYWKYINFVGYMDSLSYDAQRLLEHVGAWEKHGATGWGVNGTERIFQDSNTKAGRQHATNAKEKLTKYINTFQFEQQIEDFYIDDYTHPVMNMTLKRLHMPPRLKDLVRKSFAPTQPSSFAYAFLIGGIDLRKPKSYQEFLYGVLVASKRLREEGSQADIVVLTQYESTEEHDNKKLPQMYSAAFDDFVIIEIQIPSENGQKASFYSVQMQKFSILNLTQYDRVMYMDSDIMPLQNLDYYFNFSMSGRIQSNMIIACRSAPADGSFFMLAPQHGDYDHIFNMINQQKVNLVQNNGTWDEMNGWGHAFQEYDEYWENVGRFKQGKKWDFYAAFADQGLLYYWTKYYKQDVTIIFFKIIQHWNNTIKRNRMIVQKQHELFRNNNTIMKFHYAGLEKDGIHGWRYHKANTSPFDSTHHFHGHTKPWEQKPTSTTYDNIQIRNGYDLWFRTLREIDYIYKLGVNFTAFGTNNTKDGPLLGRKPELSHVNTTTDFVSRKHRL